MPEKSLTIGFLGLGDMGLPMACRLVDSGSKLVVWNRSRDKTERLMANGARIAATPAEVAQRADLVGICLSSHVAVEEVAFGPLGLFTTSALRLKVVADFSTGAVEASQDFARRASAHGVDWVDAPVSGGVRAASRGELIVFAGGREGALERLEHLFRPLAHRVTHMGESGSGQATKICNQAMVASNMLVMAETVAMARRAGIDVTRLPDALEGGFADSIPFQIFGPRMATHDFTPRLGAVSLMAKDAGLARALAARCGAETPILRAAEQIYARVLEGGAPAPQEDISALIRLYEDERT